MSTIPASRIVNVIPGVEGATGADFALTGLLLTPSNRIPIGAWFEYDDAASVGAVFGFNSTVYSDAVIYFNGFTGRTQAPAQLAVAQYAPQGAGAWLHGGAGFGSLTIPQIQGIAAGAGHLSIVVDGYTYATTTLDLSGATSYSAAAGNIQTALNAVLPAGALSQATDGSIIPKAPTFTGYINGNVLTVTIAPPVEPLVAGAHITGAGVTANTFIAGQLSGTPGFIGTYAVTIAQSVVSVSMTAAYGLMTIAGTNQSGSFSVGQTLSGTGVTSGTMINQLGSGTGGSGTYYVYPSQTVSNQTITATGSALSVVFDAQSQGLWITSANIGATVSSVAFATGGTAASLFLTQQTGAILSQGGDPADPITFMNTLSQAFQNWANFWTIVDPDNGAQNGPGQKLAFAKWTNSQNNRFGYFAWDKDITPTASPAATTSLGYIVNQVDDYSGTACIYDPNRDGLAAFAAGTFASVNFGELNGRTTAAFRSQTGIPASVTQDSVSNNLQLNGYNLYGSWATAAQKFTFLYPGSISGPFLWADSYENQIYMNQVLQQDLMELLVQVKSVPFNAAGGAMIEQACLSDIIRFVSFGAIRTGVVLSSLELEEVSSSTGIDPVMIGQLLFTQGWYFQVPTSSVAVRQARGPQQVNFWYVDGQSIQKITLTSTLLL